LQHNESEDGKSTSKKKRKERTEYAVVTVASGDGLIKLFKDLGADVVISGGQTNNPSSEDFIDAFDQVNADHIFVLPNNGNVVLTAKQAAKLYKDSDVRVIESKNIGQGYSALSMLDYSAGNADEIANNLKSDMQDVVTAMVSTAVRSTTVNGINITKDDYIGFTDHTMLVSTADKLDCAKDVVDKLVDDKSFVIILSGKGATLEQAKELEEYVLNTYPQVEVYPVDGGQDVYDFILILE